MLRKRPSLEKTDDSQGTNKASPAVTGDTSSDLILVYRLATNVTICSSVMYAWRVDIYFVKTPINLRHTRRALLARQFTIPILIRLEKPRF
jgi:hypothetical protein